MREHWRDISKWIVFLEFKSMLSEDERIVKELVPGVFSSDYLLIFLLKNMFYMFY